MAIDHQGIFGAKATNSNNSDKPQVPAEFWLNIGYTVAVEVTDDEGHTAYEERFVSLPQGIPLDTMKPLSAKSQNVNFAAFQSSRNNLLEQVLTVAKTLAAGESKTVAKDENTGLEIQVRRVNVALAVVEPSKNAYVRELKLVG